VVPIICGGINYITIISEKKNAMAIRRTEWCGLQGLVAWFLILFPKDISNK